MFIIGLVSGVVTYMFITKYAKFMLNLFGLNDKLEDAGDEFTYSRHPMSESETDSESESDYEDSDDDSLFEYEDNPVCKEEEIPCYMKDFYEETTLSDDWLKKSDTEKKKILDDEIDNYMNQDQKTKIKDHLKNIKC